MFSKEAKAGIVNNLGIVAGLEATPANAELIGAVIDKVVEVGIADLEVTDLENVKVEIKVFATVEFHKEVAKSTKGKEREKKLTILERYVSDTTEAYRDGVAVKVVEMRINSSGSKPMSWCRIREKLGLKYDQFHKAIRPSAGYRKAVIDRIKSLKAQEGGWEYSGKLEVLTGIEITEEELS